PRRRPLAVAAARRAARRGGRRRRGAERALVGEAPLERPMKRPAALAVLLLCVAVLAALLAADLLGYRSSIRNGDREFAADPASASWSTSTVLPAGRILGARTDLAFRRAAQSFEAVAAAGPRVRMGVHEAQDRGAV